MGYQKAFLTAAVVVACLFPASLRATATLCGMAAIRTDLIAKSFFMKLPPHSIRYLTAFVGVRDDKRRFLSWSDYLSHHPLLVAGASVGIGEGSVGEITHYEFGGEWEVENTSGVEATGRVTRFINTSSLLKDTATPGNERYNPDVVVLNSVSFMEGLFGSQLKEISVPGIRGTTWSEEYEHLVPGAPKDVRHNAMADLRYIVNDVSHLPKTTEEAMQSYREGAWSIRFMRSQGWVGKEFGTLSEANLEIIGKGETLDLAQRVLLFRELRDVVVPKLSEIIDKVEVIPLD